MEDGRQHRRILLFFLIRVTADHQTHERFTSDQARSRKYSGVLHASFLCVIQVSLVAHPVGEPAEDAADEDRERRLKWKIHADGEEHGALYFDEDQSKAHADPDKDQ